MKNPTPRAAPRMYMDPPKKIFRKVGETRFSIRESRFHY